MLNAPVNFSEDVLSAHRSLRENAAFYMQHIPAKRRSEDPDYYSGYVGYSGITREDIDNGWASGLFDLLFELECHQVEMSYWVEFEHKIFTALQNDEEFLRGPIRQDNQAFIKERDSKLADITGRIEARAWVTTTRPSLCR